MLISNDLSMFAANRVRFYRDYHTETWVAAISPTIAELWTHAIVQKAYEQANRFQLHDSAAYYFDNIDRIAQPDYLPSDQDILRSRVKTTGIVESKALVNGTSFLIVDVREALSRLLPIRNILLKQLAPGRWEDSVPSERKSVACKRVVYLCRPADGACDS